MSKIIPFIIGSVLLVGIGGFAYQQVNIEKKKNVQLVSENDALVSDLEVAKDEIDILSNENEDLYERIEILRDSIMGYENEIKNLKNKVYDKRKIIEKMEREMKDLRQQYHALNESLERIKAENLAKDDVIRQLEERRTMLQQRNDSLYMVSYQFQQDLETSSQDIVELELQKLQQEELLEILEYTQIFFDKITIKKAETGPEQKRIKKDGRAWNYTQLHIEMQHDNIRHLIDEFFVLKIIDADTDTPISFIESNPAFPDSPTDHKGLRFQFVGEPMELMFHNNQIKTGKNYVAQLYYIDDGKEYRLKNGYKQFIADGKLMK